MKDQSANDKMDLSIDFGKKIYCDSEFTIYEALNNSDSSKLLVLVVTGARVRNASLEIATEIRSACEHINSITSASNGLYPILDSGVLPGLQPFFVSAVPEGDTLASKKFDSPEELIAIVESLLHTISILHERGINQGGFNIRAEWFYYEGTLSLIFPGMRGILRRILDEGTLAPVQERRATGAFIFMNAVLTPERDVRNLCELLQYWADNAEREEIDSHKKRGYNHLKNLAEAYIEDGSSEDFVVTAFGSFLAQLKVDINYIEEAPIGGGVQGTLTNAMNDNLVEELSPGDNLRMDFNNYWDDNISNNRIDNSVNQPETSESVISESFSRAAKEVFGNSAIEKSDSGKSLSIKNNRKIVVVGAVFIVLIVFLVNYKLNVPSGNLTNTQVDTDDRSGEVSILEVEKEVDRTAPGTTTIHTSPAQASKIPARDDLSLETDNNRLLESGDVGSSLAQKKLYLESLPSPLSETDIERVFEFLNADDFELRIAAVRVLGEKSPRNIARVNRAIELMLGDEDALVRGFAAFSLVAYSGEEALPALENQLKREKSEVVSSAISRAIKRLN